MQTRSKRPKRLAAQKKRSRYEDEDNGLDDDEDDEPQPPKKRTLTRTASMDSKKNSLADEKKPAASQPRKKKELPPSLRIQQSDKELRYTKEVLTLLVDNMRLEIMALQLQSMVHREQNPQLSGFWEEIEAKHKQKKKKKGNKDIEDGPMKVKVDGTAVAKEGKPPPKDIKKEDGDTNESAPKPNVEEPEDENTDNVTDLSKGSIIHKIPRHWIDSKAINGICPPALATIHKFKQLIHAFKSPQTPRYTGGYAHPNGHPNALHPELAQSGQHSGVMKPLTHMPDQLVSASGVKLVSNSSPASQHQYPQQHQHHFPRYGHHHENYHYHHIHHIHNHIHLQHQRMHQHHPNVSRRPTQLMLPSQPPAPLTRPFSPGLKLQSKSQSAFSPAVGGIAAKSSSLQSGAGIDPPPTMTDRPHKVLDPNATMHGHLEPGPLFDNPRSRSHFKPAARFVPAHLAPSAPIEIHDLTNEASTDHEELAEQSQTAIGAQLQQSGGDPISAAAPLVLHPSSVGVVGSSRPLV